MVTILLPFQNKELPEDCSPACKVKSIQSRWKKVNNSQALWGKQFIFPA